MTIEYPFALIFILIFKFGVQFIYIYIILFKKKFTCKNSQIFSNIIGNSYMKNTKIMEKLVINAHLHSIHGKLKGHQGLIGASHVNVK